MLIDHTRVTSLPGTVPTFDFGAHVAETAIGLRFAIAVSPQTSSDSRFFETVMRNRGGLVKQFDSVEAALDWAERLASVRRKHQ